MPRRERQLLWCASLRAACAPSRWCRGARPAWSWATTATATPAGGGTRPWTASGSAAWTTPTGSQCSLARSLAHAASGAGVATHVSPCPLRFVFFLDPCNIDIVQRKMKSVALCVALCPPRLLHTYHDLMTFATLNGDSSPHARARAEEVAKNDEAPGAEPGPSRFFPGGPFGAGKKRQLRPA